MEDFENLQKMFDFLDREIRYFHVIYRKTNVKKEALIRRRGKLVEVVQKLKLMDISIVFYLNALGRINKLKFLHTLEKEYRAQCERKNLLNNTDEFFDPLQIEE